MKIPQWLKVYGDTAFRGKCPQEDAELITAINWIRREYPDTLGALTVHIENEGKRTMAQAQMAKAKGLLAGAVDILVLTTPPMAMEMKRQDHTQSRWQKGQLEFLEAAHKHGAFVGVCFGAEGFKQAVRTYLEQYPL